jgi:hypothetical protein
LSGLGPDDLDALAELAAETPEVEASRELTADRLAQTS